MAGPGRARAVPGLWWPGAAGAGVAGRGSRAAAWRSTVRSARGAAGVRGGRTGLPRGHKPGCEAARPDGAGAPDRASAACSAGPARCRGLAPRGGRVRCARLHGAALRGRRCTRVGRRAATAATRCRRPPPTSGSCRGDPDGIGGRSSGRSTAPRRSLGCSGWEVRIHRFRHAGGRGATAARGGGDPLRLSRLYRPAAAHSPRTR